jgi:endonuclease-3 related protein
MDFLQVHRRLKGALGGRDWWRAEGPWEVMVGALLTQQTSWRNVEAALRKLKARGLMDVVALATSPLSTIEECVRPAGFYRVKARRLKAMAADVLRQGGLEALLSAEPWELRGRLLEMQGVGFETADSILLYGVGFPIMVVDAYTRRIMGRLGMPLPRGYEEARRALEDGLPRDVQSYREFHALMVELGKRYCRSTPSCGPCPLLEVCPHGSRVVGGGG